MWNPDSVDDVVTSLTRHGYLPDEGLATAVHLAIRLQRPLFLEGDAGVGKTEVARVLAELRGSELIRLQCHEALDVSQALYEWDHARQLLHLRTAEAVGADVDRGQLEDELHDQRFLVRRPILAALESGVGPSPVLLIDELDRADDTFEALLLEVLADYSVTVPELGRIVATDPPVVVITSNRSRDVHDALKRRCLYHWVEHPGFEREVAALAASFRELGLAKPPGIAETIDWARAITVLGRDDLDEAVVAATLGAVLKYREDQARVLDAGIGGLLDSALATANS